MDSLLPCPFCGSKVDIFNEKTGDNLKNHVYCENCGTVHGLKGLLCKDDNCYVLGKFEEEVDCVKSWNNRINNNSNNLYKI